MGHLVQEWRERTRKKCAQQRTLQWRQQQNSIVDSSRSQTTFILFIQNGECGGQEGEREEERREGRATHNTPLMSDVERHPPQGRKCSGPKQKEAAATSSYKGGEENITNAAWWFTFVYVYICAANGRGQYLFVVSVFFNLPKCFLSFSFLIPSESNFDGVLLGDRVTLFKKAGT